MAPPQLFDERDGPTMFVKRQGPSDTNTGTTGSPTSQTSTTTQTSSTTPTQTNTSTTPTSTTNTSTTPTSTSSQSSTTPTSTTPTSTSSTPSTTSTPSVSTRPDGGVVTLTLTSTPTPTPTGNKSSGGGSSFWNNKAEVGAVFGIAGAIGLVLLFIAVTTAIRRRRARKFDRDVAEAAAAAAAASANPFFDDEEERGNSGANWDPRRGSAYNAGYGKIHDDPYGYAATGVVGGAAGAGFARQNTNQFQRNPQDAYSMNDLASSGHQMSSYSGGTTYNQHSSGAGYYDMPQPDYAQADYGRPSFSSSTAPGIAGVGAGALAAAAGTGAGQNQNQNQQNLRYRGQPQQQRPLSSGSDAYGGYSDDYDRYPNPYAPNPASMAFAQNSQDSHGNQTNQAYRAQSPPRQTSPPLPAIPTSSSPPPPPSYSGHGHSNSAGQDLKFAGAARPSSDWQHGLAAASGSQGHPAAAPMPPPNASLPATPDESYDQKGRILRVANE